MQIGVVFPQIEVEADPGWIRRFAQTAEALGYSHILAYEHVLGVDPGRPGGFEGIYTIDDPFLSPFVLFAFMASVTRRIGFVTGVLVLPQRQTTLVAKQAATLDLLCGGRLRLGVGVGWNKPEFEALGWDFHTRGQRIEEQVEAMRLLWTERVVSYQGRWHQLSHVGLNPMPQQRPIPLWFGGHADVVLRRTARLGEGWLPSYRSAEEAGPSIEKLRRYWAEAGRDPGELGLEGRVRYDEGERGQLLERVRAWEQAGATHLSLNTMRSGLKHPDEHLEAMRAFAQYLGLAE